MGKRFEQIILGVASAVNEVARKLYVGRDDNASSQELDAAARRLRRVAQAMAEPDPVDEATTHLKRKFASLLLGAEVVAAEVGDDGRVRLALGRTGERTAYMVVLDSSARSFGKVEVGPDAGLPADAPGEN
jgi:hypothetical protein